MYLRQNATYRRLSDHFGGKHQHQQHQQRTDVFSGHLACNEPTSSFSPLGPSPATPPPLTSRDFSNWTRIGRGGFGKVYRATPQPHLPNYPGSVAIKVVDKRTLKTAAAEQRLACEVAIHEALSHQSVVRVLDSFEDSRFVYLVMELCAHGDLWKYLRQRATYTGDTGDMGSSTQGALAKLSEPEARFVMRSVCAATSYLHARGALHRDLKLANLLLTREMDVKVGDFGLATWVHGETATVCGTPSYIAPETLSRQPYGSSADVWALGCLLVTLLTGRPPFTGAQRVTEQMVAQIRLPRDASEEARDLVRGMLAVDPRRRIASERLLGHAFFAPGMPETRLPTLQQLRDARGERREAGRQILAHRAGAPQRTRSDVHSRRNEHPTQNTHATHATHATQNTHAPSSAGTTPSLTLATFSTTGLAAQTRVLKTGKAHVLSTGQLVLDLPSHTMLVALDPGRGVLEYPRPPRPFSCSSSLTLQSAHARYPWDLTCLPPAVRKIARMGLRVAQHLQAQRKRITFATPQARAALYADLPLPLLRLRFFNGITVDVARNRAEMCVEIPVAQDLPNEIHKIPLVAGDFDHVGALEARVPHKIRRIVEHCGEALARAEAFDQALRQYEPGGALALEYSGSIRYPVEMPWAQDDMAVAEFVPPGLHRCEQAVGVGRQASVAHTLSTAVASTTLGARAQQQQQRQGQGRQGQVGRGVQRAWDARGMDRRIVDDTPTRRLNLGPLTRLVEEFSHQTAGSPRAAPLVIHTPANPSGPQHPPQQLQQQQQQARGSGVFDSAGFIPDVGWCVVEEDAAGQGDIVMLFCDGCRLLVDVARQLASYRDRAAEYDMLPLDHALPVRVKERLSWLPHFLAQMGQ